MPYLPDPYLTTLMRFGLGCLFFFYEEKKLKWCFLVKLLMCSFCFSFTSVSAPWTNFLLLIKLHQKIIGNIFASVTNQSINYFCCFCFLSRTGSPSRTLSTMSLSVRPVRRVTSRSITRSQSFTGVNIQEKAYRYTNQLHIQNVLAANANELVELVFV